MDVQKPHVVRDVIGMPEGKGAIGRRRRANSRKATPQHQS
jgi:hypothetical protein